MTRNRYKKRVTKEMLGSPYQELVGLVAKAMDPNSTVKTGQWVVGPDGKRDLDVIIEGSIDKEPYKVLIECKDYDPKTTGKVGIEIVDALDSKREDLPVDKAFICSNSGFTSEALRKARRKNIGMISVLKSGDPLVKNVITEEIFIVHVNISEMNVIFDGVVPQGVDIKELYYQGLPIVNWITDRIALISISNEIEKGNIVDRLRFTSQIELDYKGRKLLVNGMILRFYVDSTKYCQTVTVDASLALYNYLRGRTWLAPGKNHYTIKGIDFYGGKPVDFDTGRGELPSDYLPGESGFTFFMVQGVTFSDRKVVPELDKIIFPEDIK